MNPENPAPNHNQGQLFPEQGQLFDERVVGVTPGAGDVTRYVDYTGRLMAGSSYGPLPEVSMAATPTNEIVEELTSGDNNVFESVAQPSLPEREFGFAGRIDRLASRLSKALETGADKTENAYVKARRVASFFGKTAVQTANVVEWVSSGVSTNRDRVEQAWDRAGNTTSQRVGNLTSIATSVATEQVKTTAKKAAVGAETGVLNRLSERAERRQSPNEAELARRRAELAA